MIAPGRAEAAMETTLRRLLAEMRPEGYWTGYLSSSALSTATALSALAVANESSADAKARIQRGLNWLAQHQNGDGGWGDTPDSPSNLSTTVLCVAAMRLCASAASDVIGECGKMSLGRDGSPSRPGAPHNGGFGETALPVPQTVAAPPDDCRRVAESEATSRARGDKYIQQRAGDSAKGLVEAITKIYGQDRTFAVPILMNCALAGMVPWDAVPGLPHELAAVPHGFYKLLRLHVVSYALPALIAIGLLIHHRHPPRNPLLQWVRGAVQGRILAKLGRIQPESGGFLEATPLTSFVAMSLISLFGPEQAVAIPCLGFLRASQRDDGSWPIDTNLSVWLTTAAVAAITSASQSSRIDAPRTAAWIAARQYTSVHPYTNARPGGWAWTYLSGGVPDVDDTSGAIISLAESDSARGHVPTGARWLLSLQNSDGGWPTFCRGWGKLPFDKSAPDLTAHALRALRCADPQRHDSPIQSAVGRGFQYLAQNQCPDGSWLPLWFGNQYQAAQANPVLGTSRVLRAYEDLGVREAPALRGIAYLVKAQNPDGSWGGDCGIVSTIEETALAVTALAGWCDSDEVRAVTLRGVARLVEFVEHGGLDHPSPIGLYFASLWYSERLYPIIWALEAFGRTREVVVAASPSLQRTC